MKALTLAVIVLASATQGVSGQRGTIADTATVKPVSSSGMLYVLREERHEGSPFTQMYPRKARECFLGGGPMVQSGWVTMRGSWWVVLDTLGSCPTTGSFRLAIRVDSGIMGGTADGRGTVLMRGPASPLPGPAAMLWESGSDRAARRTSDTLTLVGADSSHLKIYVRPRAP